MKARELRIGNYVLQDNEIITGITSNSIHKFDLGLIELEPIPLTEEWLLKFGFEERIESENFSKWFSLEDNPVTRDSMLIIKQFKDDNKFFFQNGYFDLMYVHELQNLYYVLTEEELTFIDQE